MRSAPDRMQGSGPTDSFLQSGVWHDSCEVIATMLGACNARLKRDEEAIMAAEVTKKNTEVTETAKQTGSQDVEM